MSKPKLTRDQLYEIYRVSGMTFENFVTAVETLGYMDKPETKLKKAERVYRKWREEFDNQHIDTSWANTIATIDVLYEAIAELQENQ